MIFGGVDGLYSWLAVSVFTTRHGRFYPSRPALAMTHLLVDIIWCGAGGDTLRDSAPMTT
jgi:hypothetical protein